MSSENGHDNDKITPFPDAKERKNLLRLKAANDHKEPAVNLPPAVKILSLVNVAVYGMMLMLSDDTQNAINHAFGFVSARYVGDLAFGMDAIVSPVTHLFLHGSFLHLAVNVGTLMAFGTGLEKTMGARKMLALYFLSGFAGALVQLIFFPHLQGPLIGASGAISGLFGGVLMMMYYTGALGQGMSRILPLILVWLGITLFFGVFNLPGNDMPVGWAAHVGGFLAGLALFRPLMHR